MLRHPPPERRQQVLVFSAIGAVGLLAIGVALTALGVPHALGEGPFLVATFLCAATVFFGFGVFCARTWCIVYRGPRPSTKILHSGEWGLATICACCVLIFLVFAFSFTHGLRAEQVEARTFLWILTIGFYCGAVLFTLSFAGVLWQLARHGRTRLLIAENPIPAGKPLEAVLEVPFALRDAVEVKLTMELGRSEQQDADDVPTRTVAWSRNKTVVPDRSVGENRSATDIVIDLPAGRPCDDGEPFIHYHWSLVAEAVDPNLAWKAYFDMPVEFTVEPSVNSTADEEPVLAAVGSS